MYNNGNDLLQRNNSFQTKKQWNQYIFLFIFYNMYFILKFRFTKIKKILI